MNVQSIHNATFASLVTPSMLAQARDLANYHEYNVFSDPELGGIGNIAGTAMLPSILTAFQRIANASDPLLLHYSAVAYKPLLSLFNMTGVVADGALPPAIGLYSWFSPRISPLISHLSELCCWSCIRSSSASRQF